MSSYVPDRVEDSLGNLGISCEEDITGSRIIERKFMGMIKTLESTGCGALKLKLQDFCYWNNSGEAEEQVVEEKQRSPFRSSRIYGFDMIKHRFSLPNSGMP